jgi:hypothetical protein
MKLSIPKCKEPTEKLMQVVGEMFALNNEFEVGIYDPADAKFNSAILIREDIPTEKQLAFKRYFIDIYDSQNKEGLTLIFRVTTQYYPAKWHSLLQKKVEAWNLWIAVHKLDSPDTKVVGFIARKHTKVTHIDRCERYLRSKLLITTPLFAFETIYPKTADGFEKPVKTEVLGIRTSKEHAEMVDCAFARQFPADSQGEFYVSFIQDLDDDITHRILSKQNQWLKSVKLVTVSRFNNINREYDVGLSKYYSLREFMREQPTRDNTVLIEIENGGNGGKTTIIVQPEYYQDAKQIFAEFRGLTKQPTPTNTMEVDNDDDTTAYSNASAYSERMKEIFGMEAPEEFPSLNTPMDVKEPRNKDNSKQAPKRSKKASKARPNAKQHTKGARPSKPPAQSNQRSYSSIVTGLTGSESGSASDTDSDEKSIRKLLKQMKRLLIESRKESRAHRQQATANAANLQCLSKEYSRVT